MPPFNSHIWSFADQLLVSGSNFLVGIVLARTLGVEGFGAYVVAQMYLLYASTFQASLVVSPMMTTVPSAKSLTVRSHMIRGFLGFTLLVIVLTGLGVEVVAWLIGHMSPHLGVGQLALSLAAAMAAFQLQDWVRRALYVQSDNRQVFLVDVIAYGGQLAALLLISAQGELRPDIALWVMAGCFALSAIPTLVYARWWPDFTSTRHIITTHWRSSRDLFTTWQLQWVGSQGVILLGTGMIGPQAAGAIRAAQNLLGPVNVLFQWMENVVPVHATLQLKQWGRAGLVTYLGRIAITGVLALSLFALLLMLVDEPIIVFLYGEAYRPFAALVVLQALYYLFGHGYRMVNYFHRTIGNTGVLAHSSLWWAVSSVVFTLLTVNWLADRGIVLSLIVGECVALIYLLWPRPTSRTAASNTVFLNRNPNYVVLRRRDGSPYMVVPFKNQQVMRTALHMYTPFGWAGRLPLGALVRTLHWRGRVGWVESTQSLLSWCPDLPVILAALPKAREENIGLLLRDPDSRAKLTLKVMDTHGVAFAYVHICKRPDTENATGHECEVLSALAHSAVRRQIPQLIAQGSLRDSTGHFTIQSAGPEAKALQSLGNAHFAFLTELAGKETIKWATVVDQLESEVVTLLTAPYLTKLVGISLATLREEPGPTLFAAIEHGDFSPANIHSTEDGQLFVIGWEHSRVSGLAWQDALHFNYRWAASVQRKTSRDVLESLRSVFKLSMASGYAKFAPRNAVGETQYIMLYLLRRLVVHSSVGEPPASPEQSRCIDVLKALLKERNN